MTLREAWGSSPPGGRRAARWDRAVERAAGGSEERLSRLEITRETVAEILGGAGTDEAAAGASGAGGSTDKAKIEGCAWSWSGWQSAAGWPRTGPACSHCPPRRARCVIPARLRGRALLPWVRGCEPEEVFHVSVRPGFTFASDVLAAW